MTGSLYIILVLFKQKKHIIRKSLRNTYNTKVMFFCIRIIVLNNLNIFLTIRIRVKLDLLSLAESLKI